jgi:hypothetical protein
MANSADTLDKKKHRSWYQGQCGIWWIKYTQNPMLCKQCGIWWVEASLLKIPHFVNSAGFGG